MVSELMEFSIKILEQPTPLKIALNDSKRILNQKIFLEALGVGMSVT